MKRLALLIVLTIAIGSLASCSPQNSSLDPEGLQDNPSHDEGDKEAQGSQTYNSATHDLINEMGETIEERIMAPPGFERVQVENNTYAQYLRTLPLKPHGSKVEYYDGRTKGNNVHAAVIDMDIGNRDLQQCADAIMRLRAEYLFKRGQYDKIHFNFTNGFRVDYTKWMEGNRISVEGNNSYWVRRADYSNTYDSFRKYLDIIYTYAGTLSLAKELLPIDAQDLRIGDVIIQGGSPGHAVIVVDMAESLDTGEKLFLIAQSYMPAQSIHVLINPLNERLNPWYSLDFQDEIYTPEWTFTKDDFKRFN